ncbi:carotenoid ester lipase precursor [Russula earlei]|uniref:Carotenoid ester lipase n=1 Tax=Russula earlei TaxID=71964 RepID=A0ACC0TVY8_9AGAM|nr:carotenoid ester lipase precursor [Russula earlei]
MLAKRATLALLALRALSAFASPLGSFTIQDSDLHVASNAICNDIESERELPLGPEAHLDDAVFVGIRTGLTDQFLGIPFALPPTGERRLQVPEPTRPYVGIHYVQEYGKSCPQQAITLPDGLDKQLIKDVGSVVNRLYEGLTPADEDFLVVGTFISLNWIFGGGFELGGTSILKPVLPVTRAILSFPRSIDLKQPVILVTVNYRLSAFGFLPGKEVKEEKVGNLGLQDQRLALKWVQTYIKEFGGDPTKVTIWGESAGAISVSLHMLMNNGNQEGLFRGAVMQSGGPIPVGDIEHGQQYYDFMVQKTGCSAANNTLDCLRRVPYSTFKRAMDESPNFFAYQGLVLAWLPRVDGVFLTEPPQYSVLRGHVSNVPVITGNCDDEGSLFALSTTNISTSAQLKDYVKLFMMPRATDKELDNLLLEYPDDQRAGCPFDTGFRNVLSPQFKRTAALQGDFVFHGPRRFFLKHRADKQNSWGFVSKRLKDVPFIGSAHATDLVNSWFSVSATGELKDYIIRFTNNLDPNGREGLGIPWPKWDPKKPQALIFQDSILSPLVIRDDNYRSSPLDYVGNLSLRYPI